MSQSGGEEPVADVDQLVAFLQDRFGDGLRSCVVYDGSGAQTYFITEHISEAAVHSRLERIHTLHEAEQSVREPDELDTDFGRLHASVHVFGGATVVHLLLPDGSTVGISMEHAVSGRFGRFVRECQKVLYESETAGSG